MVARLYPLRRAVLIFFANTHLIDSLLSKGGFY